jgi:hypothetical protein
MASAPAAAVPAAAPAWGPLAPGDKRLRPYLEDMFALLARARPKRPVDFAAK